MEAQEKGQIGPFGLAEAGFQGQRPGVYVVNLGGRATVRLAWAEEHEEEARAIVALIAAAPDMREEVKGLQEECERLESERDEAQAEANQLAGLVADIREALEELLPLAHYRSSELDHEAAHAQDNESGLAADHKALQARRSIEKAHAALEKAKGERR